jgi:NAD-dependent SIR2 family protein deacetylase
MAEITKEQFLKEYSRALDDGNAALFAGAGTSAASGMVDWRGLLREIADGLGLDVDEESDLIGLAQYEHNNTGSRHRLNTAIVDEFNKRATPSSNHKWLAQLPIETVWTTNYDKLIENAFEAVDKRVDVKFSPSQLTAKLRNNDVTVYKMHGDVSDPDHAVLTKDDYERYEVERQAFTEILRTDLTRCCFLFLGFSFTDPNIEYILSRLRQMLKGATRIHFCIMRRPEKPTDPKLMEKYNRDVARFRHRVLDLKRFGIQTVAIDSFGEIDPLLRTLVYRIATKNVLVSGSAHEPGPIGKDRLDSLARRIGKELITRGYNLVSGYGLGVGGACILGGNEVAYFDKNMRTGQRLFLRLFPQEIPAGVNRGELYTRIRKEMVEQSGAVIFLAGNKRDASGAAVLADGVMEEYNLAKAESKVLIPVACTGHAAETIWREIEPQLASLFPKVNVQAEFNVLGDQNSSEDQLIEAVFSILKKVRSE